MSMETAAKLTDKGEEEDEMRLLHTNQRGGGQRVPELPHRIDVLRPPYKNIVLSVWRLHNVQEL